MYYFDLVTQGFYDSEINKKIPDSAKRIESSKYTELVEGICRGKIVSEINGEFHLIEYSESLEDKAERERGWRNKELSRSDIELNKVQDSDPKAIGTVSQWRDYRKYLRAWPEKPEFPQTAFRPKAPDNKDTL